MRHLVMVALLLTSCVSGRSEFHSTDSNAPPAITALARFVTARRLYTARGDDCLWYALKSSGRDAAVISVRNDCQPDAPTNGDLWRLDRSDGSVKLWDPMSRTFLTPTDEQLVQRR